MYYSKAEQNYSVAQFVPELGFNSPSEFNKAPLRVLLFFPSSIQVRVVSSTQWYLYNIIKESMGDNVFVDFSFAPYDNMKGYYYKNFNSIMGLISKHDWSDFDFIFMSIAITSEEFAKAYKYLKMSGFPLRSKDRMDDGKTPFLLAGGVAIDNTTSMDSIIDMVSHGLGERTLPTFLKTALEIRETHGDIRKNKYELIKRMAQHRGFIYPSAYHYSMNLVQGHVEHTLTSVDEGFPQSTWPDMNLPIDQYGSSGDNQWFWPQPGGSRKASILSAWGCSGAEMGCTFCHESALYGAWRERSLEDLKKGLLKAKKTSMASSFSYYSFNHNFHSRFPETIMDAYEIFDRISVLNFRVDSLAAQPEYLDLLKALGTVSISGAVEGYGDRIRNQFLKKHLKFEDWLKVAKKVFSLRFVRFKNGFIETGYETPDDWKEGFEEIRQILDARDQLGVNTMYQTNTTKLVHNYGTPLYYKPRVMSYDSWKEAFDPNYYRYPFYPLIDMGVKVKMSSSRGDTFVQQLIMDLGRLGEKVLLEPAIENDVLSRGYLDEVKRRMEMIGIDPRAQFLELDTKKNPFQHINVSYGQKAYQEPGYFDVEGSTCLRTPATVYREQPNKCHGCGQCKDIDETRKECGLPVVQKQIDLMLKRPLFTDVDIQKIQTLKMVSAPSFFYTFVFSISSKARFVSKDVLVRKFFSKLSDYDESSIVNFRRFDYSTFNYLEYDRMPSNYAGIEVVTAGFKDKLPNDYIEVVKKVNADCSTIKCIKFNEEETFGKNKYKMLVELKLKASMEDVSKIVDMLEVTPFRIYDGMGPYTELTLPFDYKIVKRDTHVSLYLIMPPKVNPMYTLLAKYSLSKLFEVCEQNIVEYFTYNDNVLYDVMDSHRYEPQGFIHVDREEEELLKESEGLECEGA